MIITGLLVEANWIHNRYFINEDCRKIQLCQDYLLLFKYILQLNKAGILYSILVLKWN